MQTYSAIDKVELFPISYPQLTICVYRKLNRKQTRAPKNTAHMHMIVYNMYD